MRYLTCFTLKNVKQAWICIRNETIEVPSANCKRIAIYAIYNVFSLKIVEQSLVCIRNITIEDPSANCKRIAIYAISHVFYVKKRQTSVDLHQKRNYRSSLRELQMNRYLCDNSRVLR